MIHSKYIWCIQGKERQDKTSSYVQNITTIIKCLFQLFKPLYRTLRHGKEVTQLLADAHIVYVTISKDCLL